METGKTNPRPRGKRPSGSRLGKILLYGGISVAATGLAGIFGGQIWLENYLKSEAFRQKTQAAIGTSLHAQCRISLPERSGTSVYIDSLEADGLSLPEQAPSRFRELRAFGIRTELDLSALWRRLWKVDSIAIQRAQVDLSPIPNASPAAPSEAGSPAKKNAPPWFAVLLPNRTQISSVRVERADVTRESNQARQIRLHALPSESTGEWSLTAEDGELLLASFPNLGPVQLQNARLQIKKEAAILRDSKLMFRGGGQALVSGEWGRTGLRELRAKLEGVPVQLFLTEWWKARLMGTVDGDVTVLSQGKESSQWEANLAMKSGKLEALPLFSELDLFLGSARFRSVNLRSASAKIVHSSAGTEFKGLKMDADGLLRLEGDILFRPGHMEGLLQVGLNASLLQWVPGARSKVFSENREGYVWAPMHISGSPEQPLEDLSKRLAAATTGAALETVTNLLTPSQKPAPPAQNPSPVPPVPAPLPLPEPVKNALDAVKTLIPGK